jgi:hypothetical protein
MTPAGPVPVIPLDAAEDGPWEARIAPVSSSDDVHVRDVAALARAEALVRIGDETRRMPVYTDEDGASWVTWDDAFAVGPSPGGNG